MLSVLIVDDDPDLLEMVELVLTNSSMNVFTMTSGNGLLEKIALTSPDIIVMDIYLGDSDGRDLCRKIKGSDDFKHIPVLLYSAGIIAPESIKTSQADKFLSKPFQIDHLISSVKELATPSAASA